MLSYADPILEIAVYLHKFHNLDLFQQGWYGIKVSSYWEGFEDVRGTPSRVMQYAAPDPTKGEPATVWQIDDESNSFCCRPFYIKYARQDVFLQEMVSFHLSFAKLHRPLLIPAIVKFELLFGADKKDASHPDSAPALLTPVAVHSFRICSEGLPGLHSYCPLHFDAWHMVLVDVTLHTVLLNAKAGLHPAHKDVAIEGDRTGIKLTAADMTVLRALYASREALNLELSSAGVSTHSLDNEGQERLPETSQSYSAGSFWKGELGFCTADETEFLAWIGKQTRSSKSAKFLDELTMQHEGKQYKFTFSAPSREKVSSPEAAGEVGQSGTVDGQTQSGSMPVEKPELVTVFDTVSQELSDMWNRFLSSHRANRASLWQRLRAAWEASCARHWSMWLVSTDLSMRSEDLYGVDSRRWLVPWQLRCPPIMWQSPKKLISRKAQEARATTVGALADLYRKSLVGVTSTAYMLQDLQIFSCLSQHPIMFVERHVQNAQSRESILDKRSPPYKSFTPAQSLGCPAEKLDKSVSRRQESIRGLHVVVFVHGFQGHHRDLRLVRNNWLRMDPLAVCLMSMANEDRTYDSFQELGERLATEVASFLEEKLGTGKRSVRRTAPCKLSFVGHSIGGVIIRAALCTEVLKPYLQYLHTFLSISAPHLGYLYSSNSLFNSGMWILKKFKGAQCMHQLTFTDKSCLEECFLFRLSQSDVLENFHHIILLASPQDRYVPYHSARMEMCSEAKKDSRRGALYKQMVQGCLCRFFEKASQKDHCLIRCDVNFDTSGQAVTLSNYVGRTAHIEFLETDFFIRSLLWTYRECFSQ